MTVGLMAGSAWIAPAAAQQQAPATSAPAAEAPVAEDESEGPDIVVQGARLPGSVIGDIPPEQTLSPADIRSYGVGSISELLTELAPQTNSGRGSGGAPVVLLDGRRISGFQEIRDLPTEAIARVEILPEEVALKYGYRADQRVVNFVLRRRFRATTIEASDRIPTGGGRNIPAGEGDLLQIRNGRRFNVHLGYQSASALTEAERGIQAQSSLFSFPGNVSAVSGGVLDPRLGTATVAGVPNANPTLADFAATAGQPTVTDPGAYRTLLPATQAFKANVIYARPIGKVSATLNATLDYSDSRAFNGLPTTTLALPAGNPFSPFANPVTVTRALDLLPLQQRGSSVTSHLGATLNGDRGAWRWTLTGTYDRVDSETFTDTGVDASAFQARLDALDRTANPFGAIPVGAGIANQAYSTSSSGEIDAVASGPLFPLPAGPVSTTIKLGADTNDFSSRSLRAGVAQSGAVSRDIGSGQVNLDLPLTSRTRGFLGGVGNLSLNGNLALDHLSDFGTLTTIGYGANWSPLVGVRVIASVTDEDEAPTQQQLGNPTITTPGVRIFDYVSGQTVTVTTLSGGNPNLSADNRHVTKLGLNLKPWSEKDVTLTADYIRSSTDDPIASFPTATAAIEAAFPDRFTRDSNGALTRIDTRPINFDSSERSQLRWGINVSKALKSKIQREFEAFRAGTGPNPFAGMTFPGGRRPGGEGGDGGPPPGGPGAGGPGGGGGGGFGGRGGGGFGGRGGQGGGRLQFAVYHTWHFTDTVTIRDGQRLDLLRGDAIGSSGGQARHELEGQAGYTNNGLGARLSVNWQSGTTVRGGTAAAPTTLDFSSLGTADLRLFADLGGRLEWVKAHPWMRGMRVTLAITNLANERIQVRDATGATPINFQPAYLDPLGRAVRLSVRKLFF